MLQTTGNSEAAIAKCFRDTPHPFALHFYQEGCNALRSSLMKFPDKFTFLCMPKLFGKPKMLKTFKGPTSALNFMEGANWAVPGF